MDDANWGVLAAGTLHRVVVVSPHFDDAVLGAAHLLATYPGATVVTVMGGPPPAYPDEPTPWDAAGGFRAGDDVVVARREEDSAAMAVLGASPVWLDFCDHQYLAAADRPSGADVAPALEAAVMAARPTAVFVPMGLGNPDHVVTHDAGRLVSAGHPEVAWFGYEDHGYKHIPGLLAWRVARLLRSGWWPTPAIVPIDPDMDRKRKAIWCYASQIPPLEQEHALSARLDANVPEQYWRLAPPPKGWEGLAQDT